MIQLMDHMKLKRKEDQRMDALGILRRKKNIIKASRGLREHGRKRRRGGKKEELGMGGDVQRVRKLNRSV